MNPVPLFLIIVTLPLLLGGCGEKPVADVKPEEPVAETKPELEGVNQDELEEREGIAYFKDTRYTGKAIALYKNGQKRAEDNFKDGKKDGLSIFWFPNGQKGNEGIYKDGITEGIHKMWHANGQMRVQAKFENGIGSAKFWNSKGESVNSFEETGLK